MLVERGEAMAETTVTIYTKPSCVQCTATKTKLDAKGIKWFEYDVTKIAAALEYVTEELGYAQAPVVVVDDQNHWSGFRPDLIDKLS